MDGLITLVVTGLAALLVAGMVLFLLYFFYRVIRNK